jgi:PadR family transcriptional regulator PadR
VVSLTLQQAKVLSLLLHGERYGRQLLKEYSNKFGHGIARPSLYTALEKLEDTGLVSSRMGADVHERGGARRKYYKVEAEGLSRFEQFVSANTMLFAST